jgi:hypothetical protein
MVENSNAFQVGAKDEERAAVAGENRTAKLLARLMARRPVEMVHGHDMLAMVESAARNAADRPQ